MSVADVDSVKTRLKEFLESLEPSGSTFYILIENCVKQFWSKHMESQLGGWEHGPVTWIEYNTSHARAIAIIKEKVIPWLRQAKLIAAQNSTYFTNFVALLSYVESHFASDASVQPAPPASNLSPPVTERAATDAVASLQYQFRALQEQINVLELTKREFYSDQRAYKAEKVFFDSAIKRLDKAQSDNKMSFDSQIAKVQREVDSFPAIQARVERLENSVATLQRPPATAPAKTRPWYYGSEQTGLAARLNGEVSTAGAEVERLGREVERLTPNVPGPSSKNKAEMLLARLNGNV